MSRFLIFIAGLLFWHILPAQSQIELIEIATGFTQPVDISNAGDDRLFIVEKRGFVKIINSNGQKLPTPFLDIDARVRSNESERGLLGLAFHPKYAENGYFFVNYTDNSGNTKISRFRAKPDQPNEADPNSELILLEINQPYSNHNAGDLAFGPDGYLYIPMGDGGSGGDPQNFSQNRTSLLGKMLRIDVDNGNPYRIPPDNPFADVEGIRPEIWALGLRNPWRFSFDRLTGDVWIADVGQNGWEEISMQPASSKGGENYGWRCYEGDANFNRSNCGDVNAYKFPEYVYPNEGRNGAGCSVTGGFVYRGSAYPNLQGQYFYADYCSGRLWSLRPDEQGGWLNMEWLDGPNDEFSTFGEDATGELYLAGLNSGKIYQLTDTNATSTGATQLIQRLTVAPNPVRDVLRIEMDVVRPSTFQFRLMDASARTFVEFQEIAGTGFVKEINTKELAAGVYFLQVQRGKEILTRKIVKSDGK